MGAPRKYKTVKELQSKIDDYFDTEEVYTITGLALHLNYTSRLALIRIEGYDKEYRNTIKRAKLRVEHSYEKRLIKTNSTGAIFALKNFGWKDTQQIEQSGSTEVKISIDPEIKEWL